MGAWGNGPFDNDGAADWRYLLLDGGGPDVVARALDGGAGDAETVAAAAVVAAAHGVPVDLPGDVADWIRDQDATALRAMASQAAAALDRLLIGSGLADLWAEVGDHSWEQETLALRDALRRAP